MAHSGSAHCRRAGSGVRRQRRRCDARVRWIDPEHNAAERCDDQRSIFAHPAKHRWKHPRAADDSGCTADR